MPWDTTAMQESHSSERTVHQVVLMAVLKGDYLPDSENTVPSTDNKGPDPGATPSAPSYSNIRTHMQTSYSILPV